MSTKLKPPPMDVKKEREHVPPRGDHIEAPGEDFYAFEQGHNATCPACLEAWLQLA